MMRRTPLCIGAGLLALACSVGDVRVDRGGTEPEGGAEPLHFYSVTAFLSAVRKTACANVGPCCKGRSVAPKDCAASLEVLFALSSDATSPFDENAALRCYQALNGTVGNCFVDPDLTPCFEITPRDKITEGQACVSSCRSAAGGGNVCSNEEYGSVCNHEDGLYCSFPLNAPGTSGTCAVLQREDGTCENQWACADGLRCDGRHCVPLLALGSPCEASDVCENGYCDLPTGSIAGTCVPDHRNGESCVVTGADSCASGNCENLTRCMPRMSTLARLWMCADFSQDGGSFCGNGVVDASSEACDGKDLGGQSCASASLGLFKTGTLSCRTDCQFDTSQCIK